MHAGKIEVFNKSKSQGAAGIHLLIKLKPVRKKGS
jgi:hypothetical protein